MSLCVHVSVFGEFASVQQVLNAQIDAQLADLVARAQMQQAIAGRADLVAHGRAPRLGARTGNNLVG